MTDQLAGIEAKLKRADENVRYLDTQIARYLKPSRAAFRRNKNLKSLIQATVQLSEKEVPPLFAVLCGEIVHHWRSVLDHIAWQLSSADYRERDPEGIEFPIFKREPRDKNGLPGFQRKIGGIESASALKHIKELQPYNGANPHAHPLAVIHDMDRFDKHRELAIIVPGIQTQMTSTLWDSAMYYYRNSHAAIPEGLAREFYKNLKFTPEVAFREIGRGKDQPVLPTLKEFGDFIRGVVLRFDGELRKC